MFTGIYRESGAAAAVLLTSFIYALTHFVGRFHIPADQVTWHSGIDLLSGTFHALSDPLSIADAFLSLFGVGVLLALIRLITGNIAACIGLHAGWVWVITFARESSVRDPAARWSAVLSTFDGVVGWLVLAWTCLIGIALCALYMRRTAARSSVSLRT
jgi:membrane protease YdiL (CAAX protease family)